MKTFDVIIETILKALSYNVNDFVEF